MPATAEAIEIKSGTYEVDPVHSSVGFEVKHMGISLFRGGFESFSGKIVSDDGVITEVSGTIDPASVDVRDETLAEHLRSADFFDVESHPEIKFGSTGVKATEDGYKLAGDLTIRGITKPVELDVKVEGAAVGPDGNDRIALSAEGVVDRNDYGMTWNMDVGNGSQVLGGDIRLVLAAEAGRS